MITSAATELQAFQSAVAHELISNYGQAVLHSVAARFQSAVAHELISNVMLAGVTVVDVRCFKALSRMSSFPTCGVVIHDACQYAHVSKRCRA